MEILDGAELVLKIGRLTEVLAKVSASRKLSQDKFLAGVFDRLGPLLESWSKFGALCIETKAANDWMQVIDAYPRIFFRGGRGGRFAARSRDRYPRVLLANLQSGDVKPWPGDSGKDDPEGWAYANDDGGYYYKFALHSRDLELPKEEWPSMAERELVRLRNISDTTWSRVEALHSALDDLIDAGWSAFLYRNQAHYESGPVADMRKRGLQFPLGEDQVAPPRKFAGLAVTLQTAGANVHRLAREWQEMLLRKRDVSAVSDYDVVDGSLSQAVEELGTAVK